MTVVLFYIKSSGISSLEYQKCFYMLCQKHNLSFKAESLTMFLFFVLMIHIMYFGAKCFILHLSLLITFLL